MHTIFLELLKNNKVRGLPGDAAVERWVVRLPSASAVPVRSPATGEGPTKKKRIIKSGLPGGTRG